MSQRYYFFYRKLQKLSYYFAPYRTSTTCYKNCLVPVLFYEFCLVKTYLFPSKQVCNFYISDLVKLKVSIYYIVNTRNYFYFYTTVTN